MIMETNEEMVDGANDTSSLQEMMNELPLEMEVEAGRGAPASKRPRTETIVNLRETRLGALLVRVESNYIPEYIINFN